MSILLAEQQEIAEDSELLDSDRRFETVDGVEVELLDKGTASSITRGRLSLQLMKFGQKEEFGEAFTGMKIQLPPPRRNRRIPDVIFVPYSRWDKDKILPDDDAWQVLPTLCVEMVGPHDTSDGIVGRVEEYLESGVDQVWVVSPRLQIIEIHDGSSIALKLRRGDTLEGGDILPGFRLPLNELFRVTVPTPANN